MLLTGLRGADNLTCLSSQPKDHDMERPPPIAPDLVSEFVL
jgi:hypothetical protein